MLAAALTAARSLRGDVLPSVPCPLCSTAVRIEPATGDTLVAVAAGLAERNEATIARIDERLRSGTYGPPCGAAAVGRARAEAKLSLLNVYHFLFGLASDPERVLEADEAGLDAVFRRFTESGLFPSARLSRARFGQGRVCLRYDLARPGAGRTVLGGLVLPYRVEDQLVDGRPRRVLSLVHSSGSVSHYEALVSDHYCFEVSRTVSPGPPGPYQLFAFHDIQGAWVRRWGTHRPAAFLFWSSPAGLDRPPGATRPLAGIRVYIPRLRIDAPILSLLGLEDLRTLELPTPLLRVDYARSGACPTWLSPGQGFQLARWEGMGPLPAAIRERFPDR